MYRLIKHIGIWLAFYVVYTFMMSYYDDYKILLRVNLVNVSLFAAAYYTLRYLQIPYLYDRGRYVLFGLSFLASSLLWASICRVNGILWMDDLIGKAYDIPFMTPGSYLVKVARFYSPAMLLIALETYHHNARQREQMQLLEKEKIANELKFLKAQINPHFLFNTLNNLYSYVVHQSPKAPDMIMRLSGILDYILYKCQSPKVALRDEVATIKNFVALEQIRYGERLQVDLSESINAPAQISPLILLSMVENAFKHGASGDIDSPSIIISIAESDGEVHCEVWNTKSQHKGELNDAYKDGIGLSNIKRQLNLLYPDTHTLEITDQEDSFGVSLTIKTAA